VTEGSYLRTARKTLHVGGPLPSGLCETTRSQRVRSRSPDVFPVEFWGSGGQRGDDLRCRTGARCQRACHAPPNTDQRGESESKRVNNRAMFNMDWNAASREAGQRQPMLVRDGRQEAGSHHAKATATSTHEQDIGYRKYTKSRGRSEE